MKFVAIAQSFAAFAVISVNADKSHLRKLSFLESKPAEEGCMDGEYRCACRDGTVCNYTYECVDAGVSGSCAPRQPNRATGLSCRDGRDCIKGNTACEDGSKCKERDGLFTYVSGVDVRSFLEAKPEDERCNKGKAWSGECTCRDGTNCFTTEKCTDKGIGGSCEKREADTGRDGDKKSCRNGEKCINQNTACEDGSKCKVRDGFAASVLRKLDIVSFLEAKPEDKRCNKGEAWSGDCTCRDGHVCYTTEKCEDRDVGGSCAWREPEDNRAGDRKSCRNGDSCIKNNTACKDGSKCKVRDGFAASARRNLSFLEAKPEDKRCNKGEAWSGECTCRDGHVCYTTEKCQDRDVGGSCEKREADTGRSGDQKSCRNGKKCIKNNTACEDGSKCKVRDGFAASVVRNLDVESFLQSKPEDPECRKGGDMEGDCTCRDGHVCYKTKECEDRDVSGSCAWREPEDNRAGDRKSCRNGESCIKKNTACRDGSACKVRDGFLQSE